MDISGIGKIPTTVSQAGTGDAVAISVMKKTLEIQAQNAAQLIQSIPLPSTNNPAHLGNSVNTFA